MKSSGLGMLPVVVAVLLLAGVTVVQGVLTDRWTSGNVAEELQKTAASLEQNFPKTFGDWEAEKELETDPRQMEVAGAVGHISRLYRNKSTGTQISTFVVCATPHDASGHTPDRCYPATGQSVPAGRPILRGSRCGPAPFRRGYAHACSGAFGPRRDPGSVGSPESSPNQTSRRLL